MNTLACTVDAGTLVAVVAAIGVAYSTAALKLRRPDGSLTRRDDAPRTVVERRDGEDTSQHR